MQIKYVSMATDGVLIAAAMVTLSNPGQTGDALLSTLDIVPPITPALLDSIIE